MTPESDTRLRIREAARTVGGRIRRSFRDSIRIDTRSLAVFRVLMGLLVVADVGLRSRNFSFYYSGAGVVPRELAMDVTAENAFSFYYYATEPWQVAALLGLQVLFAIQLIVGYKTRVATIISFLFVISLDHHNPLVTSYADTLFRLLFFWAIFLPLGERWSVDSVHAARVPRRSFAGIGAFLAMSQMVYMYLLNWHHKAQNELWTGGEATPKIMGLDDMTFLLAEYVREFPTLLQYGGLLWYYMLLFSWLLIALVGRKRYPLLALFMGGHATFALTVRIGAFPYVAIAGLILFLQPQFWDDLTAIARFLGLPPESEATYTDRLTRVANRLPRFRLESPPLVALRKPMYNVAVFVVIFSIVLFTVFTYTPVGAVAGDTVSPDERIEDGAVALNIHQPPWGVFAPNPRTTDRYYVFAAETADGDRIDIYNDGRNLTVDRPSDQLQTQYGTYRERFYMNSIRRGATDNRHNADGLLVEHLCTTWEADHGTELTHVTIHAVYEEITTETIATPTERSNWTQTLGDYSCGDHEPKGVPLPDSE